MIQTFVNRFMAAKDSVRAVFEAAHPDDYATIVATVIRTVTSDDESGDHTPDPARISLINDGGYQGTLVFVIGETGYYPSTYWYVKVGYGSCSGCDTLQALRDYSDEAPTAEQVEGYMTLALHIVQGLKEMGGDSV